MSKKWVKRSTYMAIIFVCYSLIGFFVVPPIVKRLASKQIKDITGKTPLIENTKFNPYTLSLSIENLKLYEDGETLISFDTLTVNFDTFSIFRWAFTFDEIIVVKPYASLKIRKDGSLNLLDLIKAKPKDKGTTFESEINIPRLYVKDLKIENASLFFTDLGKDPFFSSKIGPVNLNLKSFNTLPNDSGEYSLVVRTDQDEALIWKGSIALNPIASKGILNVENISVLKLSSYFLANTGFELSEGKINFSSKYNLDLNEGILAVELNGGKFNISSAKFKNNILAETTDQNEIRNINISTPLNLDISPINLKLSGVGIKPIKEGKLSVNFDINQMGNLTSKGKLLLSPLKVTLNFNLTGVPLEMTQAIVEKFVDLKIKKGFVGSKGALVFRINPNDGKAIVTFNGNAETKDLNITYADDSSLLSLGNSSLNNVNFDFNATKPQIDIKADKITVDNLKTNVLISQKGNIELLEIIKSTNTSKAPEKQKKLNQNIQVGEFSLTNTKATLTDRSLPTETTTDINDINAFITRLSSDPSSKAKLSLKGRFGEFAPFEANGFINPLAENIFADIVMSLKNLDLISFSHYSGKYIGYEIKSGKLNTNAEYTILKNELNGKNKLNMTNFDLGESVESKEAIKAPVKLGLSILRSPNGDLNLDVPISGNIKDPKFNITTIIAGTVANLIVKAATSPFTLLASLIPGSSKEDLGDISFLAGKIELEPAQKERLIKLSQALLKKPNLLLKIQGLASEKDDRLALANIELIKKIRGENTDRLDTHLTEAEERKVLKIYEKTFNENPEEIFLNKIDDSVKLENSGKMEKLALLASERIARETQIPDERLVELALKRAQNIKDFMLESGLLDVQRIETLPPELTGKAKEDRVKMKLSLNTK